ncbi:MAG: hypothetical protein IJ826_08235 [Bacteroidaceae bacterium]|nr:hypothetical protein [Bacteroidaceae bacterium]
MKTKDIEQLINKYLEGETSPAEEQKLALELQRPDIPEEWQAIRLMLGELTLGEAEYHSLLAKKSLPFGGGLERCRGWVSAISSMAAVLLVGLFLYQHIPNGNVNEVPHYYTSNLSAGSTLRNVYTSRQHKEKFLSYTQFKTMLYENH